MKQLKLWNGRGVGGRGHLYIAAYSKADACRILEEATGCRSWNHELNVYFSKGCWGNAMDNIVPERGVWETKNLGGTSIEGEPHRIYPKYTESKKKEIKCSCQAAVKCYGDPNVANRDLQIEITYCPLHAAAPALLEATKACLKYGNVGDEYKAELRNLIDKVENK